MTESIVNFENEADERVHALQLWQKPARSVLSAFYIFADEMITGGRIDPRGPQRHTQGVRLLGNLSYLVEMIERCSFDRIGSDIDDALSAIDNKTAPDITVAAAYATLCELMPAVHRGHLTVQDTEGGFRLSHTSDEMRTAEERDVILSELALPFEIHPPRLEPWMFDALYKAWPKLPGDLLLGALLSSRSHYRRAFREAPLLPRDVYSAALGFSRDDFEGFQVGLMTFADFCLGMAGAASRSARSAGNTGKLRRRHERETREWTSPLLKENFVFGMAAWLGGVNVDTFAKIMRYFTGDARKGGLPQAGEGFWPPFLRFGQAVLFSPHAVKVMLSERNLLYALNRTNRIHFDRVVSEHMEPALLADAEKLLSEKTSYRLARNVNWEVGGNKGEIDLLVVDTKSATALHVQAKAAIPPQGARMTQRIEDRTLEALSQIRAFESLPANERDAICARAIGAEVASMEWRSAVLSRSCFGTHRAWSSIGTATPLNLVLLKGALVRLSAQRSHALRDLPNIADALLDDVVAATGSRWLTEEIPVNGRLFEVTSLRFDEQQLAAFRSKILT